MIICICNNISDKEISEAVKNGAKTPCEVYKAYGCIPQCGSCKVEIQQELQTSKNKELV